MKRQRARDLRAAIDGLPLATREDMLEGIETSPIIAGADGNLQGGLCPLLAASRQPSARQGRPFARAWDRYAGARLPRAVTERELRTLRSMLAASIEIEIEPEVSLTAAISEHEVSSARTRMEPEVSLAGAISEYKHSSARTRTEREVPAEATGAPQDRDDSDRTRELSGREGWAWLRPFRRYDDYERALLELHEAALERRAAEHELDSKLEERELVASSAGRSSP
ncbi:MAG: hypothetical protein ACR2ML_06510 [Solirubrobacteraceae bacterium]